MSRFKFAVLLLVVHASCHQAFAQDAGDWVVVVRTTPIKIGVTVLQNVPPGHFALVYAGDKQWLWVSCPESTGWIARRDVALPAIASDFFSEQIGKNPRDAGAYVARGIARNFNRHFDEAIKDFDTALQLDRGNSEAWAGRALAWSFQGQNQKALADFNEALRLNPRSIRALFDRGSFLVRDCQPEKGIADLTECVRLCPNSAAAYRVRSEAWHQKREVGKTLADLGRAIELNRKDAAAFLNRCAVLVEEARFDEALADANEAIRLRPDRSAFNNRGYVHAQRGNSYEALTDYEAALELDPTYIRPRINRIAMFLELRSYENALSDLAEVLRLDANSTYALEQRGLLLAACPEAEYRDGKQAVADATRLCELARWKHADPLRILAAAFAESGDFENAVKWQTAALECATDSDLRTKLATRMKLYQDHKPYRLELPERIYWSEDEAVTPVEAREPEKLSPSAPR
jgi:tetratricopeptide (TPR) repeat protein